MCDPAVRSPIRDRPGCILATREDGRQDAPCIVLLPGLGMCAEDWPDYLIEGLAARFRVLRIDNRDMGASPRFGADPDHGATETLRSAEGGMASTGSYSLDDMAGDVIATLDARGIGRFWLLGFSMGGMIAQNVALRGPGRLEGLVLVSTSSEAGPFSAEVHDRFLRMCEPFEDKAALVRWIADDVAHFQAPCAPDEAQRMRMAEAMLAAGFTQGGFARQYRAIRATGSWREGLKHIGCPALIVCGAEDNCLPPARSQALSAAMPDADVDMVAGVGHSLEAELCNPVLDWLDRQAAETGGTQQRIALP